VPLVSIQVEGAVGVAWGAPVGSPYLESGSGPSWVVPPVVLGSQKGLFRVGRLSS
jgi:hypothetical protein